MPHDTTQTLQPVRQRVRGHETLFGDKVFVPPPRGEHNRPRNGTQKRTIEPLPSKTQPPEHHHHPNPTPKTSSPGKTNIRTAPRSHTTPQTNTNPPTNDRHSQTSRREIRGRRSRRQHHQHQQRGLSDLASSALRLHDHAAVRLPIYGVRVYVCVCVLYLTTTPQPQPTTTTLASRRRGKTVPQAEPIRPLLPRRRALALALSTGATATHDGKCRNVRRPSERNSEEARNRPFRTRCHRERRDHSVGGHAKAKQPGGRGSPLLPLSPSAGCPRRRGTGFPPPGHQPNLSRFPPGVSGVFHGCLLEGPRESPRRSCGAAEWVGAGEFRKTVPVPKTVHIYASTTYADDCHDFSGNFWTRRDGRPEGCI